MEDKDLNLAIAEYKGCVLKIFRGHPDPRDEQIQSLQAEVERLMEGLIKIKASLEASETPFYEGMKLLNELTE